MITIKKNPNGDTRTAPKGVTLEQFHEANIMHRQDVMMAMKALAREMERAGKIHDWTKLASETLIMSFYEDITATLTGGANFIEGKWYKNHIESERHHLLSRCPDDVNLLDVLEMICDCVCAGLARSGEVRELEINDDILQKAVKNTVELMQSMINVDE